MSASPTEQKPAAIGGLPAKYRPADHETSVAERWTAARAFHADPGPVLRGEKPPYCIFIPPPNVTARLHLGHALNNTLQDILVRAHRMKGFEVLWMPGTDHAGIATQAVVEQRLQKEEGKRRTDFTREQFVARVQAWKDEYEAAITDQLKKLGASCDWERQRFTMDEICARAVREAFFRLFRDGLIYRGKRLVNWDPVSQTALADDEVEMEEVDGHFYYLRYPLVRAGAVATPVTWSELAAKGYPGAGSHPGDQQAWVTVATTRPETYLGDSAVGVNPRDPRAAALRGLHCRLPIVGRIIPIIEDDYVVMPAPDPKAEGVDPKARFATGFLKVTPAHDPNDYEIGRRHNLATINVMAPDASISDAHGWIDVFEARQFVGLSREKAREAVLAAFKSGRIPGSSEPLLEKTVPYRHSVGHSYRSHVPIEPYLSDQWYCKVTDDRMKGAALRAMSPEQRPANRVGTETGDGALSFFPARYAKTFESWHEGLRDWCISRQLWWGHQIPVWHKRVLLTEKNWLDEIACKVGLDEILEGWDEGAAAIFRVSDGHRVDWRQDLNPVVRSTEGEYDIFICALHDRDMSQFEKYGYRRDPDVLDTWFSSALWPISTLGWPEPKGDMVGLLEAFNPSAVLATAREIITLWVSRMVMFNRYFLPKDHQRKLGSDLAADGRGDGPVPFRHVYINAVVQDGHGQRMSKSLGNGVDPLDIVHSHGTDALRFVLCQIATSTQDVRMPVDLVCPHCEKTFEPATTTSPAGYTVSAPNQTCPHCSKPSVSAYGVSTATVKATAAAPQARNSSSRFDAGQKFVTKLWNAARFTMMNLEGSGPVATDSQSVDIRSLPLVDRWMLSRLARTIAQAEKSLAEYEFSGYAQAMYDLVWRDFCDWYVEAIKPTIKTSEPQRMVLHQTLCAIVRLLHPVCPFVTEVLHEPLELLRRGRVGGLSVEPGADLACLAAWPAAQPGLIDPKAEAEWAELQSLVAAVRETRSAKGVEPRRRITLYLHHFPALAVRAGANPGVIESLAGLDRIETAPPPSGATMVPFAGKEIALANLADAADPEAERALLGPLVAKLEKDIAALEGRLNNPGYTARAPAKLVEETRQQLAQKQAERDAAAARLRELGP